MTSASSHVASTRKPIIFLVFIVVLVTASACHKNSVTSDIHADHHHQSASEKAACETQPSSRAAAIANAQPAAVQIVKGSGATAGMVWIPAGEYLMGASAKDDAARDRKSTRLNSSHSS